MSDVGLAQSVEKMERTSREIALTLTSLVEAQRATTDALHSICVALAPLSAGRTTRARREVAAPESPTKSPEARPTFPRDDPNGG